MKQKTILLFLTLLFSYSLFSQTQRAFDEMYAQSYKAPGGNYNKIKMKFSVTNGINLDNIINRVKEILGVKDPAGWMNPYWVTGFPDYAYYNNEVVIIGTWYTTGYDGYNTWYNKVKPMLVELKLPYYKIETLGSY